MKQPLKRVKTPTVIQAESSECGAVCLKIILSYFGKVVPLSTLREICGTGRDGMTALQLKQAALGFGLNAKAVKISAEDLYYQGTFPSVIYWDFDHFVVLEGFDRNDNAYLNDPVSGRKSIDWEHFELCFTGVVITLTPAPEFETGGKDQNLYRWFPSLLRPYKKVAYWLILLSFSLAIPELFMAGATSQFIDSFLLEGRQNIAIPVIWISIICIFLLTAMLIFEQIILRRAAKHFVNRISSLMYVSLFSLPYQFFIQRMRGDIATRLVLPFSLVELSIDGIAEFLLAVGSGFVAIMAGFFISPLLSLFTLSIAFLNFVLVMRLRNERKDLNYYLANLESECDAIGMSVVQSIETVKASGLENESFVQWSATFMKALKESQKQSIASSRLGLIGDSSSLLIQTGVLLLGGYLILSGRLTLGGLMAFLFLMSFIEQPLTELNEFVAQLQDLDGDVGRFNDIVDHRVDLKVRSFDLSSTLMRSASATSFPTTTPLKDLELIDLAFRFTATSPMMFGSISLKISPGQHVAIVGTSGSGKSTFMNLIAGLYTPTVGKILYGGKPWLDWDDSILRSSLSYVSQDIHLFSASLEDNITMWDKSFSSEDVISALDSVDLLNELGGVSCLKMPIHEAGSNLSGGQRQRVQIARSLLRKPNILLMDEATSSLDDFTEKKIFDYLKKLDITLITTAHRLYSAQISDYILVFDEGEYVQQGHPLDLANVNGIYKTLLEQELLVI